MGLHSQVAVAQLCDLPHLYQVGVAHQIPLTQLNNDATSPSHKFVTSLMELYPPLQTMLLASR